MLPGQPPAEGEEQLLSQGVDAYTYRWKVADIDIPRPPPLAQRICQLCNEGIEDETHFLNLCPQLIQERITLFKTMEGVIGSTFYSLLPGEKTLQILMLCGRNLEWERLYI